jgi:hypothetical protein
MVRNSITGETGEMKTRIRIMVTMTLGCVGLVALIFSGWLPNDQLGYMIKSCALGWSALTILCAWWIMRDARTYYNVILPIHWGLQRILKDGWKDVSNIHVSRSRESVEVAAIYLPRDFVGDENIRKQIRDLIKTKIKIGDVDFLWHLEGRRPFVQVRRAPRPPMFAPITDPYIAEAIRKAPESAPVLAVGVRRSILGPDFDADAPHMLINAGTGGGKSSTMRPIAAQLAAHGAELIILDIKRSSHKWAVGLPCVTYCRDINEIHDQLVCLRVRKNERNLLAEISDDPKIIGPRIVIMFEEMNSTMGALRTYWDENKPRGASNISPAIMAYREILMMGRSVRMNIIGVAQAGSANAMGGPEAREQFFSRFLMRYSKGVWNWLAGGLSYQPASKHRGRGHLILGQEDHEAQVIWMTDQEARDLARTGERVSGVPGGTATLPEPNVSDIGSRPLTLKELADQEIVPMTWEALRKASNRAGFPVSVGKHGNAKLYASDAIVGWFMTRGQNNGEH